MKLEEQLVEREAELVKVTADVETFRKSEEWLAAQAIHVKRDEELSRVHHAVHEAEKARLNELLGVEEAPGVEEEYDDDEDRAHETAFEQRNEAMRALLARWSGLTEEDVDERRDRHGAKSLLDDGRVVVRILLEEAAETDAIRKLKTKREKAEELQDLARKAESDMRSSGIPGVVDGQTLWDMERRLNQEAYAVSEIKDKIWKRDCAKQERAQARKRAAAKSPSAAEKAAEKAADKRSSAARKKLRSLTGFGSRSSFSHERRDEKTKERQSLLDFLKKELSL